MSQSFQVGDVVEAGGVIGVIAQFNAHPKSLCPYRIEGRGWWQSELLKLATFPIPADKDPWRESEPAVAGRFGFVDIDALYCLAQQGKGLSYYCNRAKNHAGHHVARALPRGDVLERWPQSPPAKKTGPVVGMEVVLTALGVTISNAALYPGVHGVVRSVGSGPFGVRVYFPIVGEQVYAHDQFGTHIVSAAEWNAREKPATVVADDVGGVWGSQPEMRRRWAAAVTQSVDACRITQTQTSGAEQKLTVTCSLSAMTRAVFDYDHELIALRLADHNDARNDKAAFLDRAWANASADEKSRCEWQAGILLKRAVELT